MELTFRKSAPAKSTRRKMVTYRTSSKRLLGTGNVTQLRGVGVKTAGALAVLGIDTVQQFHATYKQRGDDWLRQILPAGVRWRAVSKSLNTI
jgi:predicted flap endonuclease-1-like 5' DNA nuclease